MKKYVPRNAGFTLSEEEAQVVRLARPKSSPIHKYFEWDDTKAAQQWRLKQARNLIVSISVVVKDHKPIKAYHNVVVKDKDEEVKRSYVPFTQIKSSPELLDQIIDVAYRKLLLWREQYKDYKEFKGVYQAIDKVNLKPKRKRAS